MENDLATMWVMNLFVIGMMNDILKAMKERRSICKFKQDMPAKEEFEMPDYRQLLKKFGIEGGWKGIGHCAVGQCEENIMEI